VAFSTFSLYQYWLAASFRSYSSGQNSLPRKNLNLNGVEGFIRQILGWGEYIRGMYFYVDTDYFEQNGFNHTQPLPEFFFGR
jgi:deoxyribodipyrimidine photolyase-like uncharacterized protein